MNYNNGFPITYPQMAYQPPIQPVQLPQMPQVQQASHNNGIVWVQGEAGAKAYPVAAGNSLLLMDAEQHQFYIKSTDASGMPMPLRIFSYEEVLESTTKETKDYITREEFENRISELLNSAPKSNRRETKKDE